MTQTNPNRPWASPEAMLQLAHDIDPYKRSSPPSVELQYVAAEELRARAECGLPGTLQAAHSEQLVRYCPGCGSVGSVDAKYRDCCPDGNEARMIPQPLAEKCRATFKLAIKSAMAGAAANDAEPVAQGDALVSLAHRMFASGNSIPVDRITITRQQYESALKENGND